MRICMLWFDSSKDDLSIKVIRAAKYYQKKYQKQPNTCLVNSKIFEGKNKDFQIDYISVRPDNYVLPNHMWIGVEEKEGKEHNGKLSGVLL